MKNLLPYYWIVLSIVIFSFSSCNKKENAQYISLLQRQNTRLENLKTLSKLQHAGEGEVLKDIYVYDGDGDSIHFSRLLDDTKKIVFFFSEYSCSSCYTPFMKKMTEMYEELKDKVIIVAGVESKRDFKIYMEDKKIPFAVYRTSKNFNIFPEFNDYSLVFLISRNMVIDNLMIIDQSNKEYIDNYLLIMNKKTVQNQK